MRPLTGLSIYFAITLLIITIVYSTSELPPVPSQNTKLDINFLARLAQTPPSQDTSDSSKDSDEAQQAMGFLQQMLGKLPELFGGGGSEQQPEEAIRPEQEQNNLVNPLREDSIPSYQESPPQQQPLEDTDHLLDALLKSRQDKDIYKDFNPFQVDKYMDYIETKERIEIEQKHNEYCTKFTQEMIELCMIDGTEKNCKGQGVSEKSAAAQGTIASSQEVKEDLQSMISTIEKIIPYVQKETGGESTPSKSTSSTPDSPFKKGVAKGKEQSAESAAKLSDAAKKEQEKTQKVNSDAQSAQEAAQSLQGDARCQATIILQQTAAVSAMQAAQQASTSASAVSSSMSTVNQQAEQVYQSFMSNANTIDQAKRTTYSSTLDSTSPLLSQLQTTTQAATQASQQLLSAAQAAAAQGCPHITQQAQTLSKGAGESAKNAQALQASFPLLPAVHEAMNGYEDYLFDFTKNQKDGEVREDNEGVKGKVEGNCFCQYKGDIQDKKEETREGSAGTTKDFTFKDYKGNPEGTPKKPKIPYSSEDGRWRCEIDPKDKQDAEDANEGLPYGSEPKKSPAPPGTANPSVRDYNKFLHQERPSHVSPSTVCTYIRQGRLLPEEVDGDTLRLAMEHEEDVYSEFLTPIIFQNGGHFPGKQGGCSEIICPLDDPAVFREGGSCQRAFDHDRSPRALRMLSDEQLFQLAKENPSYMEDSRFVKEYDFRLPNHPEMLQELPDTLANNWAEMHGLNGKNSWQESVRNVSSEGLIRLADGSRKMTSFYPDEFTTATLDKGIISFEDIILRDAFLRRNEQNQLITLDGKDGRAIIPDSGLGENALSAEGGSCIIFLGETACTVEEQNILLAKAVHAPAQQTLAGRVTATLNQNKKEGVIFTGITKDKKSFSLVRLTGENRSTPLFFRGEATIQPDHKPTYTDIDFGDTTKLLYFTSHQQEAQFQFSSVSNFRGVFNQSLNTNNTHVSYVDYLDRENTVHLQAPSMIYGLFSQDAYTEVRSNHGQVMLDITNRDDMRLLHNKSNIRGQGDIRSVLTNSTLFIMQSDNPKFYESYYNNDNYPGFPFHQIEWYALVHGIHRYCNEPCDQKIIDGITTSRNSQ